MNSNEDELQKAINDITNNALNETPVTPEGEAVQPAPAADVPTDPIASEAPGMTPPVVEPLPNAPNLQVAPVTEAPVAPEAPATPVMDAPAAEPVVDAGQGGAVDMPVTAPEAPEATPEVAASDIPDLSMPDPISEPEPTPEPVAESTPEPLGEPEAQTPEAPEEPKEEKPVEEPTTNFSEKMEVEPGGVKEKALRDLMPILGKMNNVDTEKKFKVYCDIMEALDEKDIANDAYEVATQIGDDNVRGEALLKLVDLLDK
ncbi:hypothetical protein IKF33_00590 [Candidatus Saccharibacteria bacterium]|nr:hypothetical protein [Candidatus Saccharibacteria bacterium]